MKRILTLVLCWLIAFTAMAETTFKAKTAASVAGGYVTSLNKVDGSFEDGTAGWVSSTDTIVQTASTEFQGNYKGVWSGTGAGTLDLQWTATASNAYEASAQVNVQGEDDVYVCAYVGTTETGCKLIPALNKIQKVSVVADSVLSSAFNLRLKHTGSDAFSVEVDDGKIEPWIPQAVNLVQQEYLEAYGNAGTGASATVDATFTTIAKNTLSQSGSWSNNSTFTAKTNVCLDIHADVRQSASGNNDLRIYKNGVDAGIVGDYISSNVHTIHANICLTASENISVRPSASITQANGADHRITITATAISDNVVQSWQPSDLLGELRFLPQNVAPKGFISALGSSIGKTAGTYQGDAYYDLYKVLWTQSSVTAGEPYVISSAKGTDAATDWAANKTITIDVSGLVVRAFKSGTTAAVGAKQLDAFQGHYHTAYGNGLNGGGTTIAGTVGSVATINGVLGPITDGTNGTPRTSSETRMTNIAQYAFIRYGNDAPTLLALPVSKINDFTATINTNGSVATTSADWIDSASYASSKMTINYAKLGLTTAPVLIATAKNADNNTTSVTYGAVTATSADIYVSRGDAYQNYEFKVFLQKQSPDYTAPGVFMGNLNPDGFNRTAGTTGLIDSFSFSYGTTNATTVCSSSPCSYLDQIGNYVTSVTRGGVGIYTANFSKTFSKIKCSVSSSEATSSQLISITPCSNCSSIAIGSVLSSTLAGADSRGTLVCQGY